MRQLLHDTSYDPETIEKLCAAFDLTQQALHDTGQPEIVKEVIAKTILRLAGRGEDDPQRLSQAALASLKL